MSDAFEQHRVSVSDYVEHLKPRPNQHGAVYVANGAVAGVELFDKAETFGKLSPKLTWSYALDVLEASRKGGTNSADPLIVSLVVQRLKGLKSEAYPGTDLGTDLRRSDSEVSAAALEHERAILHFEAFPNH